MSKKKIFFVSFSVLLFALIWFWQERSVTELVQKVGAENANKIFVDASVETQDANDSEDLPSAKNTTIESNQSSLFSSAEVAEQHAWLRSRGNFYGDRGTEYDSYDFATLHQLADSGDLHAMHKLAHLYISEPYSKEYGFKAAEAMLMRAAVYGSSSALAELADFTHTKTIVADSEFDKRHFLVVSLGYFRAAELRGDYWGSITMRDPLLRIDPVVLEPEEKESIESFAQAIYTELEAQRESLGLGAFDNSVPASVTKLFESLKRE